MPHESELIAVLALGLSSAFLLGMLAARLRLPALVGYLLAGVAIGPYSPGPVANTAIASELAEVGVILLMFGVGLHFSVKDLLAVRRIAVPGAITQSALAAALGLGVSQLWGWRFGEGLVYGMCLSVASTVVLLRALEERGALTSLNGRIAVGWLIVEDLLTVLGLVLLPAVAGVLGGTGGEATGGGVGGLLGTLALTLGKAALFIGLMLFVGARVVPWGLERVARLGSRELFTLSVLAVALGIAYGAAVLFEVSFALGAFFAGMVVSESRLSHQAAEDALPFQDAFAVLFFVSVGMLFDYRILLERPLQVLATLGIIVVGKSIGAFALVKLLRYSTRTALSISAALAQIGEFSFILAGLGASLGLMRPEGQGLILAGAILSITLNPFAFRAMESLAGRLEVRKAAERRAGEEGGAAALAGHAVIVGYGRVGRVVAEALKVHGIPYLVIEQNRQAVAELQQQGVPALYGDASSPEVLGQATLPQARLLVVATPDPLEARLMVRFARRTNPELRIVARSHDEAERAALEDVGADRALMGEHELARAMTAVALEAYPAGR